MQSDRRQFLKNSLGVSAAVSAAPMFVPRRAWGANDKLSYALIAAGVNAKSLQVRGLGQKVPVASNQTAEGRLQNRRVVIVIASD